MRSMSASSSSSASTTSSELIDSVVQGGEPGIAWFDEMLSLLRLVRVVKRITGITGSEREDVGAMFGGGAERTWTGGASSAGSSPILRQKF